jgi:flagellar hook assembly protein FlgD
MRTGIWFAVSAPAEVSIVVYDLLGRRVATVMDGSVVAGMHSVEWDGTDQQGSTCASGVYIYRTTARAGGEATASISKKMMLIR